MSRSKRLTLWVIANFCFALFIVIAGAQAGGDGRELYLIALFGLCTTPVLCFDRINGPYVLLAVFAPFYFALFGSLDVVGILFGAYPPNTEPGAVEAEVAILSGMAFLLLGYFGGVRLGRAPALQRPAKDWPQASIMTVGLAIWVIGSLAFLYLQVFVITEKTVESQRRGLESLGPALTFAVMLGSLVSPLGMLILTYGCARYRTMMWLVLIIGLIVAQVALGFVTDVRGLALLPPVLVIVALTLIDNKVPKTWLVCGLVFLVLLFPILSAYRAAITGERGLSRDEAAQNLGKVIDLVLAYQDPGVRAADAGRSKFFERISVKGNVERIVMRTGVDVPYEGGLTLAAIPFSFVPRLIMPDKFDIPTGLLVNHTFFKGEDPNTFISPSHLGELYWNFGWPGLVLGMTLIGTLLGFVATKCSLAESASVTRMMILLATVQYLCVGFEGAMSASYVSWLRSLGAIWVLHLIFARVVARRREDQSASRLTLVPTPVAAPTPVPQLRFPNMMR